MEKNIIYHIGLPKTGTTFLQKEYFPNLRGDFFYAKRYPYPGEELFEWNQYIRGEIKSATPISGMMSSSANIIYSSEMISEIYLNKFCTIECFSDRLLEFHKIKFGEMYTPHILIGFRSFEQWITSWYAESYDLDTFDDLLERINNDLENYQYNTIEQCLRERFNSILIYHQDTIIETLDPLNSWFRNFALDGQHIGISIHNTRRKKNSNPNSIRKRQMKPNKHVEYALSLLPFSLRWVLFDWLLNLTQKKIVISDTELKRAHMIGEKLRSMDSHPPDRLVALRNSQTPLPGSYEQVIS